MNQFNAKARSKMKHQYIYIYSKVTCSAESVLYSDKTLYIYSVCLIQAIFNRNDIIKPVSGSNEYAT